MNIPTITPAEVQARIAEGEVVDLIDVRTGPEFAAVHAVGATHVPLSQCDPTKVMETRRGKTGDPIYLICKSGGRSATAAAAFLSAGYPQVVSVAGGTDAWVRAGLPVERHPLAPAAGLLVKATLVVLLAALFLPTSWMPWASGKAVSGTSHPIDFDRDVVQASRTKPVLVDFHATWCGPCQELGPELDSLVQQRHDRLALVSIDIDQEASLAKRFNVESIPDVRLWRDGRETSQFIGFRTAAEVGAWVDAAVTKATP